MKLESQVCSLEHAKKLKELGFKQDSLFYWVGDDLEYSQFRTPSDNASKNMVEPEFTEFCRTVCSAYTVAELGELLPEFIDAGSDKYILNMQKLADNKWFLQYFSHHSLLKSEVLVPEADARAKMLIWLVENKFLDLKETQ